MMLCVPKLGIRIELDSQYITNFVIEEPKAFSDMVYSAYSQCEGEEGIIIISEGAKEISFAKSVDFIQNPLSVDCNNKKVLTALYKEMDQILYLCTFESLVI